VEVYADHLNGI